MIKSEMIHYETPEGTIVFELICGKDKPLAILLEADIHTEWHPDFNDYISLRFYDCTNESLTILDIQQLVTPYNASKLLNKLAIYLLDRNGH